MNNELKINNHKKNSTEVQWAVLQPKYAHIYIYIDFMNDESGHQRKKWETNIFQQKKVGFQKGSFFFFNHSLY